MTISAPSTAADWADRHRSVQRYTVRKITDCGDKYEFSTTSGTGFLRSKTDIGEAFQPGDEFDLETIYFSHITGLRDAAGTWRFRLSDQDLADEHNAMMARFEDDRTVELEKNMKTWAAQEEALPDWLKARIRRFHDAAGEKFLRDGWGYELAVCRLAAVMADGDDAGAEKMASDEGVTGNMWGCAKALAELHARGDDDDAANVMPAATAPITGSADYT